MAAVGNDRFTATITPDRARTHRVRRRRLDRPPRDLAARHRQEARRRPRRRRRAARRRPPGRGRRRLRRRTSQEDRDHLDAPAPNAARRRHRWRCATTRWTDIFWRCFSPRTRGAPRPSAAGRRRSAARRVRRLVRVLPRSTVAHDGDARRPHPPGPRTLIESIDRLDHVASMGFDVVYLPPIHPIGVTNRKGRNNATTPHPTTSAARGRSDRPTAATPRSHPTSAPSTTSPRSPRRAANVAWTSRSTSHSSARPTTLGARASRVVRQTARRQHPVRREPAEEVPGHLPARLRVRRLAEPVAGARRRVPVLDRPRRHRVPRRQPAHQGVRVLGVGARRAAHRTPRDRVPRRGVHPAPGDGAPREDRLQPDLHLLHLAPGAVGAARVLRGPRHPHRRLLPPERLAEHTRHPHRATPDRRPSGVRQPGDPRCDAVAELGGVRPGVRAARAHRRARRAPRSTSTPRSTSCARGTSTATTRWRRCSPDSTRSAHDSGRSATCTPCTSTSATTPRILCFSKTDPAGVGRPVLVVVNLDPFERHRRSSTSTSPPSGCPTAPTTTWSTNSAASPTAGAAT